MPQRKRKPKRNPKTKLERLLDIRFKTTSYILPEDIAKEDIVPTLNNSITLDTTSISDYKQFSLDKDLYIKELKEKILERTKDRDAIQILTAEKYAIVSFQLEYIERKFPNSVLLLGQSEAANTFVTEIEYVKTMLMYQLCFLGSSLKISEEEINEFTPQYNTKKVK